MNTGELTEVLLKCLTEKSHLTFDRGILGEIRRRKAMGPQFRMLRFTDCQVAEDAATA